MKKDRIINEILGWTNDSEEIEMSKITSFSAVQQHKYTGLTKADLALYVKKDSEEKSRSNSSS